MKGIRFRPSAALVKLIMFAVVTLITTTMLATTIGNISFEEEKPYSAVFSDVGGLIAGNDVRVAGVKVGQVKDIRVVNTTQAKVTFSVRKNFTLRKSSIARIKYQNLIGGRFLSLEEGSGDNAVLPVGGEIPLEQTKNALDLTVLFNGFRPLFQALNPADVNRLSTEIIKTLQGEGGTMNELVARTASLTSTIADRDAVIGRVVTNLNTVLDTVDERDQQLDQLIVQMQRLFGGLAEDREVIGASLGRMDALAGEFAGLLGEIRAPLAADVPLLSSVAGTLAGQSEQLTQQLTALPKTLSAAGRTAAFGSWFNFYLCQATVTLDGQQIGGVTNRDPVCTQ